MELKQVIKLIIQSKKVAEVAYYYHKLTKGDKNKVRKIARLKIKLIRKNSNGV